MRMLIWSYTFRMCPKTAFRMTRLISSCLLTVFSGHLLPEPPRRKQSKRSDQILTVCRNCKPSHCGPKDRCNYCNDGYYVHSSGLCYKCLKNCKTCITLYSCQACNIGYFRITCSSPCSGCRNGDCDKTDGKCMDGCVGGYYGDYCRIKCSEGCSNQTCVQSDGWCTNGCIDGYYGAACAKCSEGCSNQTCDENDGRCADGCIDGYYGPTCSRCPGNCATCITRYPCTSCKTGFFDQYCNKGCVNCRNNTCSFETGTCDNGCIDGHYYKDGIGCQECSDNCSKCTSGSVCDQCKPGFYVSNDGHANKNGSCISCQNCTDPTTCFSKNVCPDCRDGSWGQYCQLTSSKNCLDVLNTSFNCWQHNLTCKEGCKVGFTGSDCKEEIADSSSLLMIVGSSIGVVAVAVVIVLAVIMLIRRHRSNTRIKSHGGDLSVKRRLRTDTLNRAYEDMTIYPTLVSNAGHHPTEATGDNVYANVQRPSRDPGHSGQLYESGREGSDGDHVYDVTWNPAASVKQADQSLSPAEGDTYSHITHASHNREHRHDDEGTYDHVVRENPHKGDVDDTYDVTGGQASKAHAPTDEYSTVRRVHEGMDD